MLREAEVRTTEPSILSLDPGLVAAGVCSGPGKLDHPEPTWHSERGSEHLGREPMAFIPRDPCPFA